MHSLYHPPEDEYEAIIEEENEELGLTAILAIHNTTLGPALGGMRFKEYNSHEDARVDVLRLAYGMTLKCSAAELPLGGGKLVIIGNPATQKNEAFYRWIGRFLNNVNYPRLRFVTGEDSGINEIDVGEIAKYTRHITGRPYEVGGSDNPGPMTALGVLYAIEGVLSYAAKSGRTAKRRISELTVAIQGVGGVGFPLARYLDAQGATVVFSEDLTRASGVANKDRLLRAVPGAILLPDPAQIYTVDADIFAPCAMGNIIDEETIPKLRCWAVVGSANNQLSSPEHAEMLRQRGILYAPDFIVNAGGLINVYCELLEGGYDITDAHAHLLKLKPRVRDILATAESEGKLPRDIAVEQALQRIADAT